MEIVIQTKKNIWGISRRGIRRLTTWDWSNLQHTMEWITKVQTAEAARINKQFESIDEFVSKDYEAAPRNAETWRKRKSKLAEEMQIAGEEKKAAVKEVEDTQSGWIKPRRSPLEETERIIQNRKLE